MSRQFVVKDEDWFDIDQKSGKVVAVTVPTIRPYRRRSWTEDALRAAWAYLMEQAKPEEMRISGSNTTELATRLGLLTKKALT